MDNSILEMLLKMTKPPEQTRASPYYPSEAYPSPQNDNMMALILSLLNKNSSPLSEALGINKKEEKSHDFSPDDDVLL